MATTITYFDEHVVRCVTSGAYAGDYFIALRYQEIDADGNEVDQGTRYYSTLTWRYGEPADFTISDADAAQRQAAGYAPEMEFVEAPELAPDDLLAHPDL